MRAQITLSAAMLVLGCSHEVPGTDGFGDGGGQAGETASAGPLDEESGDGSGTEAATGGASGVDGAMTSGAAGTAGTAGVDADGATESSASGLTDDGGSGGVTGTGGQSDGDADSAAVDSDACGFPLDGPWLALEYTQAGGPATSPSWSYSDTPGWGEAQWAAQGESWPEVWDLYQNIAVDNDPIGTVATVGSSGTWQLMLGFQDLAGYDHATVCVQGRSVSASASVQFDVYNPLNDCGDSASMAHDWVVHAQGVDLANCFVPGGGVQAVRIETTGGSGALGITRVGVILHGATY